MLLAGTGTSVASSGEDISVESEVSAVDSAEDVFAPAESAELVTNDGTVLSSEETATFSFTGDEPENDGDFAAMACPEAHDPAKYTVKGGHTFLKDTRRPQSSWLEPGQSVSWAVSGSHTFTWNIGVGTEAEAGVILAKAKAKLDTSITNSWTWNSTQTVTDHNGTRKAYRATLGQVGWKLTAVKKWIAAPCTPKSKTIVIRTPHKGDMSIGRSSS
jgi:hypothetical protein